MTYDIHITYTIYNITYTIPNIQMTIMMHLYQAKT